jgi:hypothetical protein
MIRFQFIKYKTLLLFLHLLFIYVGSIAQTTLSPQAEKAIQLFNASQYNEAIDIFKSLHLKFPKDQQYEYYLSAACVENNTEINTAIDLLKSASYKKVPVKVYYYLGMAYYKLFLFDQALENFQLYKDNMGFQIKQDINISKNIETIKKSSLFYTQPVSVEVYRVMRCKKTDLKNIISTLADVKIVSVSDLPNPLPPKADGNIWCVVNNNYNKDFYFFTSHENKTFKGSDIVQLTSKISSDTPGFVNVGYTVNSFGDEDWPFYFTPENIIYYASKEHGSMGGYDIFTSKYDETKNKWSEPEQLPFPFNSQHNDFVIAVTKEQIIMASDRETPFNEVMIYFIGKQNSYSKEKTNSALDMQQASLLSKLLPEKNIPLFTPTPVVANKTVATPTTITTNIATQKIYSNDYNNRNIYEALKMQHLADSMYLQSIKSKSKLQYFSEQKDRAVVFSEISKFEKKSAQYQQNADSLYSLSFKNSPQKETLYKKKQKTNTETDSVSEVQSVPQNLFSIESQTPYSTTNPYPVDMALKEGVLYRIQLGAFSNTPKFDYFGGLQPITGESLQDGKVIKYYVGLFSNYNEATQALKKVQNYKFKDAFLVAYLNGKKVPIDRAKELEKKY